MLAEVDCDATGDALGGRGEADTPADCVANITVFEDVVVAVTDTDAQAVELSVADTDAEWVPLAEDDFVVAGVALGGSDLDVSGDGVSSATVVVAVVVERIVTAEVLDEDIVDF